MDRKSPEVPTSDLKPIHFIEHDDLPTIVGQDGTINYPFGEKNNLVFASANDAHRWKKNSSDDPNKRHRYETDIRFLKYVSFAAPCSLAMSGIALLFLYFFDDRLNEDISLESMLIGEAGFAVYGVFFVMLFAAAIRRNRKAIEQNRAENTYQVLNLEHPLFLKKELFARYGGTIFDLQNDPAILEGNRDRIEDTHTEPAAIETGDSTRRMLNEHEEYLGAARRIAELWPDADQPTRDAIVEDMNRKSEKLRAACANYQADADQIAMINREKQDYLAQQEAETKTIIAEAKAVEAADEYKVIKERYNL